MTSLSENKIGGGLLLLTIDKTWCTITVCQDQNNLQKRKFGGGIGKNFKKIHSD